MKKKFLIYGGILLVAYLLFRNKNKKVSDQEMSVSDKIQNTTPQPKQDVKEVVQTQPKAVPKKTFSVVNDISYLRKPFYKDKQSPLSGAYATVYLDARFPDGRTKPDFRKKVAKANEIIRGKLAQGFNEIITIYENNKVVELKFVK